MGRDRNRNWPTIYLYWVCAEYRTCQWDARYCTSYHIHDTDAGRPPSRLKAKF